MKKIIVSCFLLGAIIPLKAQIISSFGISGGYVLANQTQQFKNLDAKFHTEALSAWGTEANVTFWKTRFFSFSTHLGYMKKGSAMRGEDINGKDYASKFIINYLYFSPRLTFGYTLKGIRPYVFASPRLDITLNEKYRMVVDGKRVNQENFNIYNDFVYGATYGVGVEKRVGRLGLGLELQHFVDFTKAADTPVTPTNVGLVHTNTAYAAYITIKRYLPVCRLRIKENAGNQSHRHL